MFLKTLLFAVRVMQQLTHSKMFLDFVEGLDRGLAISTYCVYITNFSPF